MNAARRNKLLYLTLLITGLAIVVALVLYALRQNISLYYTPTALLQGKAPMQRLLRVGGLVVKDSIQHNTHDLTVHFKLTDQQHIIEVVYHGILPDLFREGQGIVALGTWDGHGRLKASQVLAKHDEKYMPPEVASTLAQAQSNTASTTPDQHLRGNDNGSDFIGQDPRTNTTVDRDKT